MELNLKLTVEMNPIVNLLRNRQFGVSHLHVNFACNGLTFENSSSRVLELESDTVLMYQHGNE